MFHRHRINQGALPLSALTHTSLALRAIPWVSQLGGATHGRDRTDAGSRGRLDYHVFVWTHGDPRWRTPQMEMLLGQATASELVPHHLPGLPPLGEEGIVRQRHGLRQPFSLLIWPANLVGHRPSHHPLLWRTTLRRQFLDEIRVIPTSWGEWVLICPCGQSEIRDKRNQEWQHFEVKALLMRRYRITCLICSRMTKQASRYKNTSLSNVALSRSG